MKLISARARNYRIHGDTTVEFDPHRTVIGGPNETGKSTFIEAVHRGLFLKSRVTGRFLDSMRSLIYAGVPEIEIRLEVGGQEYLVKKEFNGAKGRSVLTKVKGDTWHGDEAEAKLAGILGVEPIGRKVSEDGLKSQWAHLWVWQGRGGEDPTIEVGSQNDKLIQRLQEVGGALVVQSERDSKVAENFAQKCQEVYTRSWRPKAGSELAKAQEELERAKEARREAKERFDSLQKAREEHLRASESLKQAKNELAAFTKELEDITKKMEELEKLSHEEELKVKELESAQKELRELEEAEGEVRGLSRKIKELSDSLEPKRRQKDELEAQLTGARSRREEAEAKYQKVIETVRQCRANLDFAAALISLIEKRERLEELRSRWKRVEELQKEKKDLEQELAGLPQVDKAFLSKLRKLEKGLAKAKAALDAMAAEVEVLEASETVKVDGKILSSGDSIRLTEVAEVGVGEGVKLKIRPGGGENLKGCREEKRELEEHFQKLLNEKALASLEEAEEALAKKGELESRVKEFESALGELGAENLASALKEAETTVANARGEVDRRQRQLNNPESANILEEAESLLAEAKGQLEEAESEERGLKKALDDAKKEEKGLDEQLKALTEGLIKDEQSLSEYKVRLKTLIEKYGEKEQWVASISLAKSKVGTVNAEVEKLRKRIAQLNSDFLQSDHQRLTRTCEERSNTIQKAKEIMAAKGELLRLSGNVDPKVELEEAEADLELAERRFKRIKLRSKAFRLVYELFRQKQQELAEELSAPLANCITQYLKCIFPNAEAKVDFEDNQFKGIKLVRKGWEVEGALDFEKLSGGTKEQVAAAVRLAIAELLAEEHGGCLPVVFDDAFVNTDPERIKTVQRMLDLAAVRGLQIIVLTSNPSDYAGLGGKEQRLTAF